MRVLNLVATLSVASAACYSPSFKPCQFTCEGATTCPGDLTCGADRVCHARGATDSCSAVVDGGSGTDGGPGRDGGGSVCTNVPVETKLVSMPGQQCLSLSINAEKWGAAKNKCGSGGWELAVFSVAPPVAGELPATEKIWIGLERSSGTSMTWNWIDGSQPAVALTDSRWSGAPNSGLNNVTAAVFGPMLFSDNASTTYRFACTKGLTAAGN